MNKAAKGTRIEKKAEDELKKQGYITWRVRRNKFANMDLWGLFDVCGWKKTWELYKPTFIFVQCKSNRADKKTINAVKEFKYSITDCCESEIRAEIWVWHDRNSPKKLKGWEIIR